MSRYHVYIIVAAVLLLAGVIGYLEVAPGIRVTVRNTGQDLVRDVKVHVTGRTYRLGDLAPDAFRTRKVSPTSESHVEVEFTDSEGNIRLDAGGYFEPGYRGQIDIEIRNRKLVAVRHEVRISIY